VSRRPLGAQLDPAIRLVAYEATIRDFYAAVDELADAMHAMSTGRSWEGRRINADQASGMIWDAWVHLQEIKERGIRAPRNGDAGVGVAGRRR
jgi:hypothetical protein